MLINTNFDQRTAVHADPVNWTKTRMPGVERHMLDRIGAESGHATSIVRYAPGSSFSPHVHQGGEEFIVLDGVFQDEHADYPVGTYVRNPPTSKHTPSSDKGCTIFVKLWQFDPDDRTQLVVDTNTALKSGDQTLELFKDSREQVRLENLQPGQSIKLSAPEGMEILVLQGELVESGEVFGKHAWLRLPRGYEGTANAGSTGVRVWTKHGNLADVPG